MARGSGTILGLWLSACSSSTPGVPSPLEEAPDAGTKPARSVQIDEPALPGSMQLHFELQRHVHLADLEQPGLFVDFGTPARMKYSVGHWRTGWGRDGVEGADSFTPVLAASARLYLPLADSVAMRLRLRMKPLASNTLQPFLNNEPLASIALDRGAGFAEYEVQVPAGVARAGENQLLLRFAEPPSQPPAAALEQPLAAVDWLQILPLTAAGQPVAGAAAVSGQGDRASVPDGKLVRAFASGGYTRNAIALQAPARLSYHLELPRAAKLTVRVGSPGGNAQAVLRITPAGGKPAELWRGQLSDAWLLLQLPLDTYAGQVVKLELCALGSGVAGFASPAIVEPRAAPAAQDQRPQGVIVLLVDTLRADRLRAYNPESRVRTPALDALAAQGAVFEAAQAPENWTKPSVASVLTGLYPTSHGTKTGDALLAERAQLVSEVFKEAGFATGLFAANGFVSDRFGFNQGWDRYTNYVREKRNTNADNVLRDAANWIEEHRRERFFAYIQTIDPHVPYDPPDEFLEPYQSEPYTGPIRPWLTASQLEKAKQVPPKLELTETDRAYLSALYNGEVSFHDRYLGVFIDRLKRMGLYDRVLFVVTADHGEEFYDHKSFGHGHTLYQELIGVPFIARHPGSVKARRVREPVSTIDIAPTILSAAGVPIPETMEGRDRLPQLLGAPAPPLSAAFSDFLDDRRAVRSGRFKLILRGLTPTLFDLGSDPAEQVELNLAEHPIALRYCRILLGAFLGADNRGDFANPAPARPSLQLRGENAQIDEATRAGLRALGYAN